MKNNKIRNGNKDIWNAYMSKNCKYTANDIPICPTTSDKIPTAIITWEEAKKIYKKNISKKKYEFFEKSYICFYIDDYKFDGPRGIWHDSKQTLKIIKHFDGVITPDFSTFQDFPEPIKIYATYRMRLFGYWLGENGVSVINNVRWGTPETYKYCFDGIQNNSVIAIGSVGGNPRKIIDRERFENGLFEMVKRLEPCIIIVYGSANYECFNILKNQGITIISFPSKTSIAYERGRSYE